MRQHHTDRHVSLLLVVALAALGETGLAQSTLPDRPADETAPADTAARPEGEPVIPWDELERHVPDPELDRKMAEEILEQALSENDTVTVTYVRRLLQRVETIRRPEQLHLTLEQALHRALANSYAISVQRFNPAVNTASVVEAQAAFDAVFFGNITKNKIDRPSASELLSTNIDRLDSRFGFRKLLPSGMQVSASYGFRRQFTVFAFQQLNPEYFNDLVLEMRQPFLRGFGIDFNRSLIVVAKNDRRISHWAFRRQVRDTLRTVEELYWRLVQARRDVAITARLLADFESIYDYLLARRDFDVMPVQLAATKASLERSRVEFVRVRAGVFDAEDRFIAAMNDTEVNLADNVEIIPDNFPRIELISLDRLAEAQTALENRPEIREQKLRIANARVFVGRAKNGELPQLDLTFRYTVDGLGSNADRAFDQLTQNNFMEYFVGVELEVPIGNRGPRAARRRAELQHEQAIAQLQATVEEVLLDVNLAVRGFSTAYDQIAPSFESAEAREQEVKSIVARAERRDFNTLNSELNARQSLASARRAMLAAIVDYNVAIIDLERAKGTLLRYYNVVIPHKDE